MVAYGGGYVCGCLCLYYIKEEIMARTVYIGGEELSLSDGAKLCGTSYENFGARINKAEKDGYSACTVRGVIVHLEKHERLLGDEEKDDHGSGIAPWYDAIYEVHAELTKRMDKIVTRMNELERENAALKKKVSEVWGIQ